MAKQKVYFLGIGGTGMATVAGLAIEFGYEVFGSDQNLYPPMSTMLEDMKIPVFTPYDANNLNKVNPDLAVITNAVSKDHAEVKKIMEKNIPFMSFPQFLEENILPEKSTIVVTGTHGKTTTSSLIAHVLGALKTSPSYFIGGLQKSTNRSFLKGEGNLFILEGDEYDTAFFDKNSKFLHYLPEYLLLNNLEFDHADIFSDLEAIKKQFLSLITLVKDPSKIIANVDDDDVVDLLKRSETFDKAIKVSTRGITKDADVSLTEIGPMDDKPDIWRYRVFTENFGELVIESSLVGAHNGANICQAIGVLNRLKSEPEYKKLDARHVENAFASFAGVERRLQKLYEGKGITVIEDFAHHPTAVNLVLESFKKTHPNHKITACFEPKNATSRRNIFISKYAQAFQKADRVLIGACPEDKRILESERMNTSKLAEAIGEKKATSFEKNEDLLEHLKQSVGENECVVFMSAGSFSDIHKQYVQWLIAN